jgi:glycosyltransferase involved in cell wall biosynthesis
MSRKRLHVEGWRFIPHSYALVNMSQCAELARRSDIILTHRDVPFADPSWLPVGGILPLATEEMIAGIPEASPADPSGVTYRISFPFNFQRSADRLFVFMTCESSVDFRHVVGAPTLGEAQHASEATIVTPSKWSKDGLVRAGGDPNHIAVVPHGVAPEVFHPLGVEERAALRARRGVQNRFVFLSVGAMTANKGIGSLLSAFAVIAARFPHAVLLMKGNDALYNSRRLLEQHFKTTQTAHLADRLLYIGSACSAADMAMLYQMADAYVSPYYAEGFNMPVLEAAACGLPIIATAGGPTDEFTHASFALPVESKMHEISQGATSSAGLVLSPDLDHLVNQMATIITDDAYRARARTSAARYVADKFTWADVVERLVQQI